MWMQVQTFYNSLHPNTQTMVDATNEGDFINKTPEEGYWLIEVMASNNLLKSTDRNAQKRTTDIHDIDTFNYLAAQVVILNNNLKKMNVVAVSNLVCENCVGNHSSLECQAGGPYEANSSEQVNYVANNQRQYNPNSNIFQPRVEESSELLME